MLARLRELVARAKGADPLAPVTVVVPTPYAGLSLRRALAREKGLINVRFMVISRAAEFIGSPVMAAQGRLPLPALFEFASIQQSAASLQGRPPLGEMASHPSLQNSLSATFRELDRLSGAGLIKLAAVDELRAQTVAWYRSARALTSAYYTREEMNRAAVRSLQDERAQGVLGDLGRLVFYLTDAVSPAELALLDALFRTGRADLIAGLCGEPGPDRRLREMVLHLNPRGPVSPPDFEDPHRSVRQALIAHDYQEEVKWIVRHILKRAEEGLAFSQMAVFYHDPYPYAAYIAEQLSAAGIPAAGPSRTLLRDTPPGKLLLLLLDVIRNELSRDSLMHWIAEAPVRAVPSQAPASAELSRWEIISSSAGIIKGAERWQTGLQNWRRGLSAKLNSREELNPSQIAGLNAEIQSLDLLLNFTARLAQIAVPSTGSSFRVFADWIVDLLDEYVYAVSSWPEAARDDLEKVKEQLAATAALDVLIPGGTTLDDFENLVKNALQSAAGRLGDTGRGVLVAPLSTARGMSFQQVYITGMSEGAYPPRARIDPLLPDSVRRALEDEALPLLREKAVVERRHYLAALAGADSVVVTFCRTDPSAERAHYPSPWFVAELERLGGRPFNAEDIENPAPQPWLSVVLSTEQALLYAGRVTPLDLHDYDMSALFRWRRNPGGLPEHYLLAETTPAGWAVKMEKARRSSLFTEWDGNLSAVASQSRRLGLAGPARFAPTRLEKWAGCPLSYFFSHVLQIPVYEKPEEIFSIEPTERGSLIHRILERFMRPLIENGHQPDYGRPWSQPQQDELLRVARAEFEQLEARGLTGHPSLWRYTREEIEQDLLAFLAADNKLREEKGLKPVRVEQSFGLARPESRPPVVLNTAQGEIHLQGFIDRVDADRTGRCFLVIDYKTGSAGPYSAMKTHPLENGRRLQLPVYALAVREAEQTQTAAGLSPLSPEETAAGIGAADVSAASVSAADVSAASVSAASVSAADVSAAYWFISTRGGFALREVSLPLVEAEFRQKVETIVAGIHRGVFIAHPGESVCGYCDFERLCPPDRDLLWERKSTDPAAQPYLALLDQPENPEDAP